MVFSADQLAVFAAVVDHGTVTAAARELSVSQPAVSARLRSLQALAGRKLYMPTSRGIALTPAGEALLPHARAVARAMQRARHAIATPTSRPATRRRRVSANGRPRPAKRTPLQPEMRRPSGD